MKNLLQKQKRKLKIYKLYFLLSNSTNYLNHPNLLFIVNKSKKIEENEIIKPNIIIGLDLDFSFLFRLFFEEFKFLSFF